MTTFITVILVVFVIGPFMTYVANENKKKIMEEIKKELKDTKSCKCRN
jgi:hypothetical protein